jgi:hypothetical protein
MNCNLRKYFISVFYNLDMPGKYCLFRSKPIAMQQF